MFREGDWVLIRYEDRRYLKRLSPGFSLSVKKDILRLSDILGKRDGVSLGKFQVFSPTIEDIVLLGFERKTQIIYPKDAFYIAFKLNIEPSSRVLEFGTGSGAMCAVLSRLAGEVYTYEVSERFFKTALNNFNKFSIGKNIHAHNMDFMEADIEEHYFDSAFVDVREPVPYLKKLHGVLKEGAPVGFLMPTTNQVVELLSSLEGMFGAVEVVEILLRYYKTVPQRLRPTDTMIGHTAYLVFCRKITP